MKLPVLLAFVLLLVAFGGCGGQAEPAAAATPLPPTPTAAPQPTPSPVLALMLRRDGIVLHDLTQSEEACPGFLETIAPLDVSPDNFSDQPVEVVRQVRLVCTNGEKGTVYFVNLSDQTITVTRKLPPVPGMP